MSANWWIGAAVALVFAGISTWVAFSWTMPLIQEMKDREFLSESQLHLVEERLNSRVDQTAVGLSADLQEQISALEASLRRETKDALNKLSGELRENTDNEQRDKK